MADTDYLYVVVATDRIEGLPDGGGDDDAGKGSLAAGTGGRFADGFEILKGEWNPVGYFSYFFDTKEEADAWVAGPEGKKLIDRYESVNLFRLCA